MVDGRVVLQNRSNYPLNDVPLSALTDDTRLILYTLDQEMILLSDDGNFRDWRGILAKSPVKRTFREFLRTSAGNNKMQLLLDEWMVTKNNNLEQLQEALKKIDRYDIYEDTLECFQEDAKNHEQMQSNRQLARTEQGDYIITSLDRSRVNRGEKLIIYDAFLMYSEADEDFAELIKDTLEKYDMHICTKNDFLGGIPFEHDACMNLIAKRCRKVIIVVSKLFLNSKPDIFISKYAQHIGIEQTNRKIVPCLREECEIPSNLRILFHLKYYKNGSLFKFWMKLYEAVAYDVTEQDLNENNEFVYIPHGEYRELNVPELKKKNLLMLPQSEDSTSSEKTLRQDVPFNAIGMLPSPPSMSPNSSSEKESSTKKKSNKSIKWLRKLVGKKQNKMELTDPLSI